MSNFCPFSHLLWDTLTRLFCVGVTHTDIDIEINARCSSSVIDFKL